MAIEKPPALPYRPPAARPAIIEDDSDSAIDIMRVDNGISQSLRKQVTDAIKKNPKLGLAIIRGWKDQGR